MLYPIFNIVTNCSIKGLVGYLQVMLQFTTYITAIKIARIEIIITCINVFGLRVVNNN